MTEKQEAILGHLVRRVLTLQAQVDFLLEERIAKVTCAPFAHHLKAGLLADTVDYIADNIKKNSAGLIEEWAPSEKDEAKIDSVIAELDSFIDEHLNKFR